VPDARKTLDELYSEWVNCTQCDLGKHRKNNGGEFVFGEGALGGIMFIGEGPGVEEEKEGRPFVGRSGRLLRAILEKLGATDVYITNLVTCRSCEPVLDESGLPRLFQRKRGPAIPMFKDIPPLPAHWKTCQPRLHEEIYLVDPKIIVTLGNTAAEAVIGGHFTITKDRCVDYTIDVPGAGQRAVLTEKKQVWYRKVAGEMTAPTEQAMVRYYTVPTLHPAYVLRMIADRGPKSPFQQLVGDIRYAIKRYDQYMQIVYGRTPGTGSDTNNEEVYSAYEATGELDE
jgi:uracil-DNA glycosylase